MHMLTAMQTLFSLQWILVKKNIAVIQHYIESYSINKTENISYILFVWIKWVFTTSRGRM